MLSLISGSHSRFGSTFSPSAICSPPQISALCSASGILILFCPISLLLFSSFSCTPPQSLCLSMLLYSLSTGMFHLIFYTPQEGFLNSSHNLSVISLVSLRTYQKRWGFLIRVAVDSLPLLWARNLSMWKQV